MKNRIVTVLALALCAGLLAACTATKPTETTTTTTATAVEETTTTTAAEETVPAEDGPVGPVAGGWTLTEETTEANLPEEAKKAFEKATDGLTGAGYTPLAYLGSQLVAGTNYGFLCKVTTVTAQPVSKLCVVKVYADLEGNASILETTDVDVLGSDKDMEIAYGENGLCGGWTINTENLGKLPENVQKAFDTALEGMTGVGYQPLAYLGSQVVTGANYAVLCTATRVASQPASGLCVVTLYANLEGGAEVLNIAGFPFP